MSIVHANLILEEIGRFAIPGIDKILSEVETGYVSFEVATGTSNSAFPISTVTGITTIAVFYIESDQTISWKQSSGDTACTVTANGFQLLFNTSMTAILLSNASGSTANVKIYVAG